MKPTLASATAPFRRHAQRSLVGYEPRPTARRIHTGFTERNGYRGIYTRANLDRRTAPPRGISLGVYAQRDFESTIATWFGTDHLLRIHDTLPGERVLQCIRFLTSSTAVSPVSGQEYLRLHFIKKGSNFHTLGTLNSHYVHEASQRLRQVPYRIAGEQR